MANLGSGASNISLRVGRDASRMRRHSSIGTAVSAQLEAHGDKAVANGPRGTGSAEDAVEMPPAQIGRALRELGITWIAAQSPQAKRRVERNFGTAQDRLVKELRVAGVKTIRTSQPISDGR